MLILQTGRTGFRDELKDRDRDGTCIVTRDVIFTLTPKEAECASFFVLFYLDAFSHPPQAQHLSRSVVNRGGGHEINNIDDIRNGLLLSQAIHRVFGRSYGFLDGDDFCLFQNEHWLISHCPSVIFHLPPGPGSILGPQSASPGRFTLQQFRQLDQYTIRNSPHNQDARLPADMNQFPPSIIVDMYYGSAAMLQWGIAQSSAAIWSSLESLYYDNIGSGRETSSEWVKQTTGTTQRHPGIFDPRNGQIEITRSPGRTLTRVSSTSRTLVTCYPIMCLESVKDNHHFLMT
jgi:hypothetical protein